MIKYAQLLDKIQSFLVEAKKVYGPYSRNDGRQIVIVKEDDGSKRTVSYPKHIMEEHLGHRLDPDLGTVDHLDFNFLNNDLSNLVVKKRDEHSADDTRRVKLVKLKCTNCKKKFERSPRLMRDKNKKGNRGTFCSRSCSAKFFRNKDNKDKIDNLQVQDFVKSRYYRRKNVRAFVLNLIVKYS